MRWARTVRFAAFFVAVVQICAADDAKPRWETGLPLAERLASPVQFSWTNTPLARTLASLGQSQRVAILLDRRIDPSQPVTLSVDGVSLAEALSQLAAQAHAGYAQLGPVAYLGPPQAAANLRTLAALRLEELQSIDKQRARKLLTLRPWQWEDLAEPRELLAALASDAEVDISGGEQIPHDLWRAADLPPSSWIDRLSLLAVQFDLTFQVREGGAAVRLVPIPREVLLTRSYPAGVNAAALAQRWASAVPTAQVIARGNQIRVAARLEDHEQIEARFRSVPSRRPKVTAGKEVYQFTVENAALDAVVDQLAERLDLDVRWDTAAIEKARLSSNQLISVQVKDAELDELLAAILADTGFTFRRAERKVEIVPAQ